MGELTSTVPQKVTCERLCDGSVVEWQISAADDKICGD